MWILSAVCTRSWKYNCSPVSSTFIDEFRYHFGQFSGDRLRVFLPAAQGTGLSDGTLERGSASSYQDGVSLKPSLFVATSIHICDMRERDHRSRVSISFIARMTYPRATICQGQTPCYISRLCCVELPLEQVLQIKNVLDVVLDGSLHPSNRQ